MIGTGQREAVRTLQDEAVALRTEVATLGRQLAAVMVQLAAQQELMADGSAREMQLQDRIIALEARMADQAAELASRAVDQDSQADEIASLRTADEQKGEAVSQLRGQLARLERQAAIDLDEMRRASTAIAASLLPGRPPERAAHGGPDLS